MSWGLYRVVAMHNDAIDMVDRREDHRGVWCLGSLLDIGMLDRTYVKICTQCFGCAPRTTRLKPCLPSGPRLRLYLKNLHFFDLSINQCLYVL